MRILIACLDYERLWAIDNVISGLYSIDLKTFETECVIDFRRLFQYGKFEVQSLLKWKKNYIIIIPREIDRYWIFFNKITGEIEYRKVIEQKCQEIMAAVDKDKELLYFFPLYIQDPILIVDLNQLACSQVIENWRGEVPEKELCGGNLTAWKGAYNKEKIYFPIKDTRILMQMDCRTREVNLLEIDIPEKVIDVDYAFGELWLLPISGNRLYQLDENGFIINTAELSMKDFGNSIPNFARIVVQKRYVFLLPCYRQGIYVYDKVERKVHIIPEESQVIRKKDKDFHLEYWEYYVKDNQICFLPYRHEYIEINLDTLAYKTKKLFYPNIWPHKEKIQRCIWSHASENDSIVRENEACNLNTFLEYIQYPINIEDSSRSNHMGKKIWEIARI